MNPIERNRKRLQVSQKELANMIQVSQPTIWQWEHNNCEPPLSKAIALAKIFGVEVNELAEKEDVSA